MRLWQEHMYVQEAILTRRFKRLQVYEQRERPRSGLYLPIPSCFP